MANKRIQDLYFGVMRPAWDGKPVLEPGNLFDCGNIRYWAAKWILRNPESVNPIRDPISFIFNDVWARAEYEWIVADLTHDVSDMKMDLYEAYVKPNAELLLSMVEECSKNSARKYIREVDKRSTR